MRIIANNDAAQWSRGNHLRETRLLLSSDHNDNNLPGTLLITLRLK
jgi:hypothetical protein